MYELIKQVMSSQTRPSLEKFETVDPAEVVPLRSRADERMPDQLFTPVMEMFAGIMGSRLLRFDGHESFETLLSAKLDMYRLS